MPIWCEHRTCMYHVRCMYVSCVHVTCMYNIEKDSASYTTSNAPAWSCCHLGSAKRHNMHVKMLACCFVFYLFYLFISSSFVALRLASDFFLLFYFVCWKFTLIICLVLPQLQLVKTLFFLYLICVFLVFNQLVKSLFVLLLNMHFFVLLFLITLASEKIASVLKFHSEWILLAMRSYFIFLRNCTHGLTTHLLLTLQVHRCLSRIMCS